MKASTSSIQVLPERRRAFVDVTDALRRAIKDSGVTTGCAVAFCSHTTACLLINEWEDGALDDLQGRLEALVPSDVYYAHDDLDRRTQNLQEGHERENGGQTTAPLGFEKRHLAGCTGKTVRGCRKRPAGEPQTILSYGLVDQH